MSALGTAPVRGRRFFITSFVAAAFALAAPAETAFARGPASSKNVYVTSISAQCAGDVLSGQADASGPTGRTFTLRIAQIVGGRSTDTALSQTVTLGATQASYAYSFDISSLAADGYVVRSDRPASKDSGGNTDSRVVAASECAPPPEVAEAPVALLLPLSGVVTLLAFAELARRRRRRVVA